MVKTSFFIFDLIVELSNDFRIGVSEQNVRMTIPAADRFRNATFKKESVIRISVVFKQLYEKVPLDMGVRCCPMDHGKTRPSYQKELYWIRSSTKSNGVSCYPTFVIEVCFLLFRCKVAPDVLAFHCRTDFDEKAYWITISDVILVVSTGRA